MAGGLKGNVAVLRLRIDQGGVALCALKGGLIVGEELELANSAKVVDLGLAIGDGVRLNEKNDVVPSLFLFVGCRRKGLTWLGTRRSCNLIAVGPNATKGIEPVLSENEALRILPLTLFLEYSRISTLAQTASMEKSLERTLRDAIVSFEDIILGGLNGKRRGVMMMWTFFFLSLSFFWRWKLTIFRWHL